MCATDAVWLMQRKILIMGLPGAGKTTLTRELAPLINAVIFNADEVRANLDRDLGFSIEDRIEQARRMGWLCDQVVKAGGTAIADFICPIAETREAFGPAFTIWSHNQPIRLACSIRSSIKKPIAIEIGPDLVGVENDSVYKRYQLASERSFACPPATP